MFMSVKMFVLNGSSSTKASRKFGIAAILAATAFASCAGQASAVSFFYDGSLVGGIGNAASDGGTGDWSTGIDNWDVAPSGSARVVWPSAGTVNDAVFGGTGGLVTLQTPIVVHNLTTSVSGYTIAGSGANTLTLNGTTPTISGSITISAAIAGTTSLTKSTSGGTLALSGDNTFTGNVSFTGTSTSNAGNIRLSSSTALGQVGTAKTISNTAATNDSTGALELSGGITIDQTKTYSTGGRTTLAATKAHLRSVSGNNTWAGLIRQTAIGGSSVIDSASATGTLTLGTAGSTAITTTLTGGTRNFSFYGAGNTTIVGNVADNSADATGVIRVLKQDAGTLTLSGTNNYSGGTALSAGTLLVSSGSSTGSGAVTVNGGTLGGSGTTGAVSMSSGNIAPGTSIGTLNTGAVTASGGAYLAEINTSSVVGSTGASDKLAITGDLTLGAGATALTLTDLGGDVALADGTQFVLATYTGSQTGIFTGRADDSQFALGANTYEINYNDVVGGANAVTLTAVLVPEPASLVLLGGVAVVGLMRRRRA